METRNTKTRLWVLVALLVLVSRAQGTEHLTINGEDVASIDLAVGQSCTIEVVSDGGALPYIHKLTPTNFSLSDLELLEIKPEAGAGASVTPAGGGTEYDLRAGSGFVAGVHFVFGYTATSTGPKEVELRYFFPADPIDSVVINVTPAPAGTAFTYQGDLSDGGGAADGEYDFEFKVYDSPTAGDQVGLTVSKEDVSVYQGKFTVRLDFVDNPDVFNGEARWLEIGVRPWDDSGSFTPLSPRQELTPTPYALYALNGQGSSGFWAASANDIYNTNSGNVGIGPMTPVTPLSVDTNTQFDPGDYRDRRLGSLLLTLSSGQEGLYEYGPALSFSGINTGRRRAAIASVQTTDDRDQVGLAFFTHWGTLSAYDDVYQAMLISHAGNVTIGEMTPVTPLGIATNTQFDPGDYRDRRLGSVMLTLIGGEEGLYKYGPALSFSGINTVRRRAAIASVQTSDDHDQVGLAFFTYPSTNTAYDNVHQAMLINHAGNVGIGTDAHDGRLSIASGRTDEAYISLNPGGEAANDIMGVRVSESGNNTTKMHFGREFTVDGAFLDFVTMDGAGNVGIGTSSPAEKLTVRGNLLILSEGTGASVLELGEGLDYAEGFDVSAQDKIDAGSVLIIDADNPGKLALSNNPYDTKVAGIIAGAKGLGSGVRLGAGQFDYDVALAGRVYCKVDATDEAIQAGDLLTTSATPGYAMKAVDYTRSHGAILGKAMESLEKGQKGQLLVLVTLQ